MSNVINFWEYGPCMARKKKQTFPLQILYLQSYFILFFNLLFFQIELCIRAKHIYWHHHQLQQQQQQQQQYLTNMSQL